MSDTATAIQETIFFSRKKKSTRRVSLETYLDREERAVDKHEFHNGTIVRMPGAKAIHNQIAAQLTSAIIVATEEINPTFIIYNSDMKIYIPLYNHAVYPDAVVVCEAPEYWNGREDIILNPVLIVEVLSNSTEDYDRNDKFMKYKTLPSFKEYVLVRQDKYYMETWHREAPGLWRETIQEDKNGTINFNSLGITIDLKKVYKNISFK